MANAVDWTTFQDGINDLDVAPHELGNPQLPAAPAAAILTFNQINGFDEIADVTGVIGREYLEANQRMAIPWPRVNETVAEYSTRLHENRGKYLVKLSLHSYGRFGCPESNCGGDICRLLGLTNAKLTLTVLGGMMRRAAGFDPYLVPSSDPAYAQGNDNELALDRIAQIVKLQECVPDNVAVTKDPNHPDMDKIMIMSGVPVRLVHYHTSLTSRSVCSERDTLRYAHTVGLVALCASKIMLFRTGHHYQTTETHVSQIAKIVEAVGATDIVRSFGGQNDRGALSMYRVMPHAFYGWVVRGLLGAFEGTASNALTIRLSGYGAGWARVNVLTAVVEAARNDRALSALLLLMFGADAETIMGYMRPNTVIPTPNNTHFPDPRCCMVVGAFVPGQGAPMPEHVAETLRRNATVIQASCEVIGGSLAAQKTYSKDARSTRAIKEVYHALRVNSTDAVTAELVGQAFAGAAAAEARLDMIRAAMEEGFTDRI